MKPTLFALTLIVSGCATARPVREPTVMRARVESVLGESFAERLDRMTTSPQSLDLALSLEQERLADGPLFLLVLPLYACANLVLSETVYRAEALPRMRVLLDALLSETVARVGVEDLTRLDQLHDQGTWLGQVALALGVWRLVGGDARDARLHAHLVELITRALRESDGAPLRSYPNLRWSFDTVPALVALRVWDVVNRRDTHREVIARALAWQDGHVDASTGLPGSRMELAGDTFTDVPRGSDLALRIALLGQLDPARARSMYARFVAHFGRTVWGVPAFAEWPDGMVRDADRDSGEIVMGVGTAATGFGLAAARAVGDDFRADALREALRRLPSLRARAGLREGGGDGSVTRSLAGDVAMFWALTWTDWNVRAR